MTILIDTNVIAEVYKAARCDRNVAVWYASVPEGDLYLSVIVTGEIRRGIELARYSAPGRAAALERWLATLRAQFAERLLAVDAAVADEWGRLSAIRTIPVADGLLAATAKVHGMTLATRNEADVAGLGVAVVNPFRPRAEPR